MPANSRATPPLPGLPTVAGKPIIARFDGGALSSDGGLLALREVEARLGVARRLAACIDDPRAPERIQHSLAEMLRFRMLMIAAGYEDGNDADCTAPGFLDTRLHYAARLSLVSRHAARASSGLRASSDQTESFGRVKIFAKTTS